MDRLKHLGITSIPLLHPSFPIPQMVWLRDQGRSMGIHLMAGKGTGKSRLMGRIIAWMDFIRGVPQVIFDPHGPTIDNFLDKMLYLPRWIQEKLWPRVLYVDMSGRSGQVVPFPLYFKLADESPFEISQRFLDVIRKMDPHLQTASVEGWNALWRIGTYVGMLCTALDLQITEAERLVLNPRWWKAQMAQAVKVHPELAPALSYLEDLDGMSSRDRARRIDAFMNKIAVFSLEPSMKAMFGAAEPGISWDKVVHERRTVLLDFRHEHDIERRRFKMVWAFNWLLDFVKHRGAGRHTPIGVMIDELTSLFSFPALASDLFGSELDELINVLARNYSVWLTIAHQEMFQVSERILKSLMTMGTQIVGATTDPDAAELMARNFYRYDPRWVRKLEPIYASAMGMPILIDYRTVEYTIEEQINLMSRHFRDLARFEFLASVAPLEGEVGRGLRSITISRFDKGLYPHGPMLEHVRRELMQRSGTPIVEVIEELKKRVKAGGRSTRLLQPNEPDQDATQRRIPLWGE